MRALRTALIGVLAVSAAGLLLYRACGTVHEAGSAAEHPAAEPLQLQDPAQDPETFSSPARAGDAPDAEPAELPQRPVQTIEERGDAMLFEADALSTMPFDQEITMPFD